MPKISVNFDEFAVHYGKKWHGLDHFWAIIVQNSFIMLYLGLMQLITALEQKIVVSESYIHGSKKYMPNFPHNSLIFYIPFEKKAAIFVLEQLLT